jgi:dolichol-phosphate mannosyltransferase
MQSKELISIVVPVFNESEVIGVFYDRLKNTLDSLDELHHEIIFVDDGSTDDSYYKLTEMASSDYTIKLIKLSRNFGHQIAITAGIDIARGHMVVVIDADLQDPPETIKAFVAKRNEGYDVVYGVRDKRHGEGKLKLLTAKLFYRILKAFTNVDIPIDVGDFRLMNKRAVQHLRKIRERDRFVRGLVSWVGFEQTGVHYTRDRRYAGTTKYPYRKMLKFAFDGITSFSTIPLKLSTWLGYLTSALALFYACTVFIQKAIGITVQGWATIMVAMLFLGGVQLICIGIIGEYLGRTFNETKQRPIYIIEEIYSLNENVEQEQLPEVAPIKLRS